MKKLRIFNDPIYGFISIKDPLVFKIIEHPYFQRLRRISQMGLSYLVYPGAHHTRFHHVIGCTYLMREAINVLRMKEVEISKEEERGLLIAILLHDLGHGPFSHALEGSFFTDIGHEEISLRFMETLNQELDGELDLAIQIFKGDYQRNFMNQLISGQLDMDRLDYLKRDSFYSGVAEGNINVERLISMLHVKDEQLVLEHKGIYSAEKFIMARRFMYWQVYLHKTGVVAENILVKVIKRAKDLLAQGHRVECSPYLKTFLRNDLNEGSLDEMLLERFARLDDHDVMQAIKSWSEHDDFILSYLCNSIINRRLPRIEILNEKFPTEKLNKIKAEVKSQYQLSDEDLDYFVYSGEVSNTAYKSDPSGIKILFKSGKVTDMKDASDSESIKALSQSTVKYFLCYPKKFS